MDNWTSENEIAVSEAHRIRSSSTPTRSPSTVRLFRVKENICLRLQIKICESGRKKGEKGSFFERNVKELLDTFSFTCYNNSCQETQHTGGLEND